MRNSASHCQCAELPSFREFLPTTHSVWKEISTPRQVNAVVRQMALEMQALAGDPKQMSPFKSTPELIRRAFEKAKTSFLPTTEEMEHHSNIKSKSHHSSPTTKYDPDL